MSRTLETLTIKAEEIRKGDQSLTDKGSVAWTALNDAGVAIPGVGFTKACVGSADGVPGQ